MRSIFFTSVAFVMLLMVQSSAFASEIQSNNLNESAVTRVQENDFLIAKTLSGSMSSKQIADCAALNETSADIYRKMEVEGKFPIETIRKVALREQNFWVTAYSLASGQDISYEELTKLSHYRGEYLAQKATGVTHTPSFGRAVLRCAAQKKEAAFQVNGHLGQDEARK